MSSENAPLAVGLDFGGTSIKLGVCQGENFVAKADPIPTDGHGSVDALIEVMAVEINKLREAHPAITAVGAGIPGFVDFEKGYLHNLTNVPGWHNVPFKAIMEQKLGLPVLVENDANAMAYAEYKFGAAKGLTNVVCLTLGTGVGGGIILGGEVYRGSSFGAGEIGQMCIDFEGKAGNYGNMGALEKYVGNQQIEEHAILAYANVGQAKAKGECTPRHIAEWAEAGDPIAKRIWGDIGLWLGAALTSITWILNPDAIVIGGGVAKAGNLLFEPLEHHMHSMLNPIFWERMNVVQAKFGNESGMLGCAALALDAEAAK